ncbi:MAG: SIR2 family protein [Prevotellaceae bacterium]|jgi:NAD-dependent SIR2 family protein deacetylase|nr:SIR2 family protein [Prevotellaceae bacterium]
MSHKEVINNLLDKKVAILAGAGISYDSGLPTVSAFYNHFLPMFYEPKDVSYLTELIFEKGHIPFERIMEHIFSYTGNDYSIMDIFANGEPNTLHSILAKMMLHGWVNEIYTTNFDRLIEKALTTNGLHTQTDYGYFYDERGFSKLSKSTYEKNVIKIHGTIDKKDSIRTTLETIIYPQQLIKRKPPIERLFSTGQHDVVIVLGYSFSDIFDISEFIKKLNITKTIIVISHKNGEKEDNNIQLLANKKGNNPFLGKGYRGYVAHMNTLTFMSELCIAKYSHVPTAHPTKYDWKNYLDNWVLKYDNPHKAYIAGGICNSMNEFILGNKYITQALKTVNRNRIELYISIINHYVLSRFRTRKDQKECDNLVSLCKHVIELLKNNEDNLSKDFYIMRLDDLTYRLGRIYEDGYFDYKKALCQYFSVYRIEYRAHDILEMSKTLHEIGKSYAALDNIVSATKCLKKSIRLKKKCGYIGGITRTYYTMAAELIKNNSRKLKQAETYLRKAEKNVEVVGEIDLTFYIHNLQGVILMKKQEWEKAASVLTDNIVSLANQPHKDIIATANYDLARCEVRLKKYNNAITRLEENLKIVHNLGDQQRIFRNNQELAIAYLLQNKPTKCYEYLLNNFHSLNSATNADKGYYFFYVALYYKKFNIKKYYQLFLDVSKTFFQTNEIIRDFYRIKRDIDKEVIPDKTLILAKDKYLLQKDIDTIIQHISNKKIENNVQKIHNTHKSIEKTLNMEHYTEKY